MRFALFFFGSAAITMRASLRVRAIKKQVRVMRTCVKACVIVVQPNTESNHRVNPASESPRQ